MPGRRAQVLQISEPFPGPAPGPIPPPLEDHRTLSELRADALAHRLLGGFDGPDAGAFRAEVVVTIPVGLVLG